VCSSDLKKKKVNPKEVPGKKLACPFARHDPARYKSVKTCCGPGWADVHRVKEHIYRRHSLKNFCPRCFEHFDKPDLLKQHQRADVPCQLRDKSPGGITEEQEKLLRMRAKSNCSEEDRWEDMYRAIFPGEKVPSPYYDSESDSSSKSAKSQFQNLAEAKEFLRVEIPRLVQPEIEKYVNTLFEEVQEKVNQKTVEIIRNVETKVLRTFHFQEEQASALPSAAAASILGTHGGILAAAAEPSRDGRQGHAAPGSGYGGADAAHGCADGGGARGIRRAALALHRARATEVERGGIRRLAGRTRAAIQRLRRRRIIKGLMSSEEDST